MTSKFFYQDMAYLDKEQKLTKLKADIYCFVIKNVIVTQRRGFNLLLTITDLNNLKKRKRASGKCKYYAPHGSVPITCSLSMKHNFDWESNPESDCSSL